MSLKEWASKQSNNIKLEDGETITAKYKGYEEGEFKGTPRIGYHLEIDGEVKKLFSSSVKFAAKMNDISVGETIKITRSGEGVETRYGVVVKPTEEPKSTEEVWDEV